MGFISDMMGKGAFKRQQQAILDMSHPAASDAEKKIERDYGEFCREKHIVPPPKLRFYFDMSGINANANAISSANTICVSETVATLGLKDSEIRGLLAHETAHILLGNDLDATTKRVEFATDRLAVALLGEAQPLVDGLEALKRHWSKVRTEALEGIPPDQQRNLERMFEAGGKKRELQRYGEHEERIAKIRAYNPHDAKLVAEALAAYTERQRGARAERTRYGG